MSELRGKVAGLGYGEPTIQRFGAENQVSIRMKLPEGADKNPELANTMASKITDAAEGRLSRRAHRRRGFGFGQGVGRTV